MNVFYPARLLYSGNNYGNATVVISNKAMTNSVMNAHVYYSPHIEVSLMDTSNNNLYKITLFINTTLINVNKIYFKNNQKNGSFYRKCDPKLKSLPSIPNHNP